MSDCERQIQSCDIATALVRRALPPDWIDWQFQSLAVALASRVHPAYIELFPRDAAMSAVAFDTLEFARALQGKAKLTAEQAEGIAEAFVAATGEQLATKTDVSNLATKADVAEVKAEILKWMFGQTLLILGAIIALSHFGR